MASGVFQKFFGSGSSIKINLYGGMQGTFKWWLIRLFSIYLIVQLSLVYTYFYLPFGKEFNPILSQPYSILLGRIDLVAAIVMICGFAIAWRKDNAVSLSVFSLFAISFLLLKTYFSLNLSMPLVDYIARYFHILKPGDAYNLSLFHPLYVFVTTSIPMYFSVLWYWIITRPCYMLCSQSDREETELYFLR